MVSLIIIQVINTLLLGTLVAIVGLSAWVLRRILLDNTTTHIPRRGRAVVPNNYKTNEPGFYPPIHDNPEVLSETERDELNWMRENGQFDDSEETR